MTYDEAMRLAVGQLAKVRHPDMPEGQHVVWHDTHQTFITHGPAGHHAYQPGETERDTIWEIAP